MPAVANDVGADPVGLDEKVARATEVARVRASLRRKLYIEAEHHARAALSRRADDPVLLILLAQALLAQEVDGHIAEVRRSLSRALAAQPDNDEGYVVAAAMYRRDGDHRRASQGVVRSLRASEGNGADPKRR